MATDAALRITKARVEFITEPEHLDMIEPSVRGGMTSVSDTRYAKANNRYLTGFQPKEPSTFAFSVNANNFYSGVMQDEFLLIANFKVPNKVSIGEILNTPTYSTIGYFVEVDLEYPASSHDQQRLSPSGSEGNSVR